MARLVSTALCLQLARELSAEVLLLPYPIVAASAVRSG